MGLSILKSCSVNSECVAPNPNPKMFNIISRESFSNSTLIRVKYRGCTNFEGEKLIVYLGNFIPTRRLDPHFRNEDAGPIARFRPDNIGYRLAINFCRSL